MNNKIGFYASIVNAAMVVLFGICLVGGSGFGTYFSSFFISVSFVAMCCAFRAKADAEHSVAANCGMVIGAMYAVIIELVYFAQMTTVRQGGLSEEAAAILDFKQLGLLFNYDMLGYALMALSTFFLGLTITTNKETKTWIKWLKALLLIHGVFFLSCFIMPVAGVFKQAGNEASSQGGSLALAFWCIYFIPVGILSAKYFGNDKH